MKKKEFNKNCLSYISCRYRISIVCSMLICATTACHIANKSTTSPYKPSSFLDIPILVPPWFTQIWFYVNLALDDPLSPRNEHTFQTNNPSGDFTIHCENNTLHKFECLSYILSPTLQYSRTISSPGQEDIVQYCTVQFADGLLI